MNPERPSHIMWTDIDCGLVNQILAENEVEALNLAQRRLQGLKGMLQEVKEARDQARNRSAADVVTDMSIKPFADWDKEVQILGNELLEWKKFMETKGWSDGLDSE